MNVFVVYRLNYNLLLIFCAIASASPSSNVSRAKNSLRCISFGDRGADGGLGVTGMEDAAVGAGTM